MDSTACKRGANSFRQMCLRQLVRHPLQASISRTRHPPFTWTYPLQIPYFKSIMSIPDSGRRYLPWKTRLKTMFFSEHIQNKRISWSPRVSDPQLFESPAGAKPKPDAAHKVHDGRPPNLEGKTRPSAAIALEYKSICLLNWDPPGSAHHMGSQASSPDKGTQWNTGNPLRRDSACNPWSHFCPPGYLYRSMDCHRSTSCLVFVLSSLGFLYRHKMDPLGTTSQITSTQHLRGTHPTSGKLGCSKPPSSKGPITPEGSMALRRFDSKGSKTGPLGDAKDRPWRNVQAKFWQGKTCKPILATTKNDPTTSWKLGNPTGFLGFPKPHM